MATSASAATIATEFIAETIATSATCAIATAFIEAAIPTTTSARPEKST